MSAAMPLRCSSLDFAGAMPDGPDAALEAIGHVHTRRTTVCRPVVQSLGGIPGACMARYCIESWDSNDALMRSFVTFFLL